MSTINVSAPPPPPSGGGWIPLSADGQWVWDGTRWSPTSRARAPGGRVARCLLRLVAVVLRIPLAVAALILGAIVRTALGCAVVGLLVAAIGAFFVYSSTH
jgi:hypothetical protein